MAVVETLRQHGLSVANGRPFAEGRPYDWSVEAIMYHWTGAAPRADNPVPSQATVINGRTGVPGPLYGWLLGGDAQWRWITDGRHNHAGGGNDTALAEARSGHASTTEARLRGLPDIAGVSGNRWTLGVSVESNGSSPLTGDVRRAFVDGIAALAVHYGLTPGHTFGHAAYTRRKIDFPTSEMVRYRAEITEAYNRMTFLTAPVVDVIDPEGTATMPGRIPFWTVYSSGLVTSVNGARPITDPVTDLQSPITSAEYRDGKLVLIARGDGGTFAYRPTP